MFPNKVYCTLQNLQPMIVIKAYNNIYNVCFGNISYYVKENMNSFIKGM